MTKDQQIADMGERIRQLETALRDSRVEVRVEPDDALGCLERCTGPFDVWRRTPEKYDEVVKERDRWIQRNQELEQKLTKIREIVK